MWPFFSLDVYITFYFLFPCVLSCLSDVCLWESWQSLNLEMYPLFGGNIFCNILLKISSLQFSSFLSVSFFFYLIPYGMPFSFSYLFSYFFHFFLFSFLEDFLNFIFQLFCWVFHFQHNLKEISKSSFFVIWMSILFFSIYSFSWTQKYFLSGNINDAFIYSFIFKVFFSLYNVGLFQDNMCVALSLDWLVMIKSWGFQSWLEDLSAWVRFCTLL